MKVNMRSKGKVREKLGIAGGRLRERKREREKQRQKQRERKNQVSRLLTTF